MNKFEKNDNNIELVCVMNHKLNTQMFCLNRCHHRVYLVDVPDVNYNVLLPLVSKLNN